MMNFIRRRWRRILVFSLPFFVGLFLSILAQLFMPTIFPILSSVDFGTAAFVFGMTIRNPAVVFFSFGFLVTAFIILIYYWDRRHIAQTQTMYADYLQEAGDRRRNFLRRLDHEIKNPLTGLRAALVNLTEEKTEEERQRAVGMPTVLPNVSHAY
jgi:signal transduction histidine kinase